MKASRVIPRSRLRRRVPARARRAGSSALLPTAACSLLCHVPCRVSADPRRAAVLRFGAGNVLDPRQGRRGARRVRARRSGSAVHRGQPVQPAAPTAPDRELSRRADSNCRPAVYETAALPAELRRLGGTSGELARRGPDDADEARSAYVGPHWRFSHVLNVRAAARDKGGDVSSDRHARVLSRLVLRIDAFPHILPPNDPDGAVREAQRAVRELGALGIQIHTNVNGMPLDDPRFAPLFAAMAELDKPIWVHPARIATHPDYVTEQRSKFEMWWVFG